MAAFLNRRSVAPQHANGNPVVTGELSIQELVRDNDRLRQMVAELLLENQSLRWKLKAECPDQVTAL